MVVRFAAVMALLVFMVCLISGSAADNPFATTVERALLGMVVTMVIGLILGAMGKRMLEENLQTEQEKLKNSSARSTPGDR